MKLKMIWRLFFSNNWIVVTESEVCANATTSLMSTAVMILVSNIADKAITDYKMDSAVDEVNEILKSRI